MAAEGTPFRGFPLLRVDAHPDGPKVIEFNVRFGDPEAQVVLPLIGRASHPGATGSGRGEAPPLGRRPTADQCPKSGFSRTSVVWSSWPRTAIPARCDWET